MFSIILAPRGPKQAEKEAVKASTEKYEKT
jgi:hypothetical protein